MVYHANQNCCGAIIGMLIWFHGEYNLGDTMTEHFSSPAQEWLKFQQEYWNKYLSPSIDPNDKGDWTHTIETWWQTFIPSLSSSNYEVVKKFIEQSQQYLFFGEEFIKTYPGLSNAETSEWQHFVETHFKEKFLALIVKQNGMIFGELPFKSWQQAFASFSSLSCDMLKLFDQKHFTQEEHPWFPWAGHFIRRWQEHMQERIHLWTSYQTAQEAYTNLFLKMSMNAVEQFSKKLLTPEENKIDHLRALYDLWIECSEEAYITIVKEDEYAKVQARLINSLVALKHSERKWIDEFLCALNVPTRKELDTLNASVQQMKRDMHRLRQQHELTLDELHKEIALLRQQLEESKTHTSTSRKRTSKTAKKKTSE